MSTTTQLASIHFPLVRKAITPRRRTGPRFEIVPDDSGLSGSRACACGMVVAAIHRRQSAAKYLSEAQIAEGRGDLRAANIAKIAARRERRTMRSYALWVRVFADHIRDNDPRLEEISRESQEQLQRAYRAGIYSDRWQRVQLQKFDAGLTPQRRARINDLLARIAAKHDALAPWGHTLSPHLYAAA